MPIVLLRSACVNPRPLTGRAWKTAPVFRLRRAVLVPTALALVAIAPARARAEPSASFATSLRLLNQPAGRPWAVKLNVAGEFSDSEGIDSQPILQTLTFNLPDATVNVTGVQTCSAEPIVAVANDYDPCPRRLAHRTTEASITSRVPVIPHS